ncbi:MAG TPA: class I SAM-dependent rRNA methyltransferase [Bacteroidales bacterium]|nr:class I SAM-dependent rRNA methyltransferase [Bacteroidales bacterium]HOK99341.1 class I SAM-dependent rRNA methyltransferase [Bacteroidales bacterium]HPO65849.1 class I SAM-dependent rRNA methyltransferase [Bacteroidales bacterium]
MVELILKEGKEKSIKRRHPWVFSGAIEQIPDNLEEGQLVKLYDKEHNFLAVGHFQKGTIAVRVLSFEDVEIDRDFWYARLLAAYRLRQKLGLVESDDTNVYRLVHGEGDEIPGLIIDIYDRTAVIQCHSIGVYQNRSVIVDILQEIYQHQLDAIYDKSEATLPFKSGINPQNEYLYGVLVDNQVKENGHLFLVDWEKGQKTGLFIDQRDNRQLLARYSAGKKVLNLFCYTGGFSVYALKAGADLVHSVDSSKFAIEMTEKNIELNFGSSANHAAYLSDALQFLQNAEESYDIIVLDPPAYAKHGQVLNNAIQAYKRINQRAIEKVNPGGLVFTFSCSQVMTRENFRKTVFAAAANAKRKVSILYQLTQAPDHPVNIYHPEGEYLKGLVLYVE